MGVFSKSYSKKIVNYDLLNKFNYNSLNELPHLSNIILKFDFKKYDYKLLIKCLFILELLSGKTPSVILSKKSELSLKIKKGFPVGCKVNLHREFSSILNIIVTIQKSMCYKFKISKNYIDIDIANVLNLPQLQNNYYFFKNIKNLNVRILVTSNNQKEMFYLMNSYKMSHEKQK